MTTSTKLKILERQMLRQTPEQPPVSEGGHGLGVAIEKLIADEVERRVGEAEQRQSPKVERLMQSFNKPVPVTDYRQLPPTPRTQPMKAMDITFQRDEFRRIAVIDMGGEQWRVQRGALGEIVRMVPIADAPMPALTPRKIYGNDQEGV